MQTKYQFDTVIAKTEQIVRVWAENPTFVIGDVTLPGLEAKLKELRQKREQVEIVRTQLTALVNDLHARTAGMADLSTRLRSGIRAVFGPDSTQYEQAGCTRVSERKRPSPKRITSPVS